MGRKKKMAMERRHNLMGCVFLSIRSASDLLDQLYPMIELYSFQ